MPAIAPAAEEVFWVGGPTNNYHYTKDQVAGVCTGHCAVVATDAQLTSTQAAGADWCAAGWLSDHANAKYPITTTTGPGCGNGSARIKVYNPPGGKACINCYGVKPEKDAASEAIMRGFNPTKWSRYA
jgi:hypothetical protein